MRKSLVALFLCGVSHAALAQNAVLQYGPWTPGDSPIYAPGPGGGNQPAIVDGGPSTLTLATIGQGLTALNKFGLFSILQSGAACNAYSQSPTDDTLTMATWFATVSPGSTVFFPPNTFCLHNSNLTLPAGVRFAAVGMPIGSVNQGGNPQGGGFVHPGSAQLIASFADVFDHIGVWRSMDGFFHINPTFAQSNADVWQWYNEWSEGVTLPQVVGNPTSHGVEFIKTFVEGFHWGVYNQASQLKIDGLYGDNTVCLAQFNAGDLSVANNLRCEPWYSGELTIASGAWQRYGACFYINGGGGYNGDTWQCEFFPMGGVFEASGAFKLSGLQYEYAGSATLTSPYIPENYGVGWRDIGPSGSNTTLEHVVANSDNVTSTPAVMTDAVVIDAGNSKTSWENVFADYVPASGSAFYASGSTAVPITEQITAIPSPGGTVSLTLSGALPASVGGPFIMTYGPILASDTPATVALALDALCNTNHSELAHAHIACLTSPFIATLGKLGVYFPSDQAGNVTVAVGGATVTSGTGSAIGGSTGVLKNLDISLFGGSAVNGATVNSSTGTPTPGACTLTLSGGTFTSAATFTGTVSGLSVGPLTVATPGSYTIAPGTTNVAATGCGFATMRLNLSWSSLGNNIVLGNTTTGAAAWQIDGVFSNSLQFSLPANWLTFSVAPARVFASNIEWSPATTANLGACTGSCPTVGANSFDNSGTITIPAGQTATLTFRTPYPGPTMPTPFLENCSVTAQGGSATSWTTTQQALAVTNGGGGSDTFSYSCSFGGHS